MAIQERIDRLVSIWKIADTMIRAAWTGSIALPERHAPGFAKNLAEHLPGAILYPEDRAYRVCSGRSTLVIEYGECPVGICLNVDGAPGGEHPFTGTSKATRRVYLDHYSREMIKYTPEQYAPFNPSSRRIIRELYRATGDEEPEKTELLRVATWLGRLELGSGKMLPEPDISFLENE